MNKQEAIDILTGLYRIPVEKGADKFASEINKAIDMAIGALSAERTGEWEHDGSDWENRWVCSECGYKLFEEQTTYCGNCGAKMGGDTK